MWKTVVAPVTTGIVDGVYTNYNVENEYFSVNNFIGKDYSYFTSSVRNY